MPYEYLHRPKSQTCLSNGDYLSREEEDMTKTPSLMPPEFQASSKRSLYSSHPAINIDPKAEQEAEMNAAKIQESTQADHIMSSSSDSGKLSKETTELMNSQLGANFENVQIHTGSDAIQMNEEVGSEALTRGKDIFFNKNRYDEKSKEGRSLLAHELTHVKQQKGQSQPKSQPFIQNWIDYAEEEYEEKKDEATDFVEDVIDDLTDSEGGEEIVEDLIDQAKDAVTDAEDFDPNAVILMVMKEGAESVRNDIKEAKKYGNRAYTGVQDGVKKGGGFVGKTVEKGANFIEEGGKNGWNTAEHLAHKGKKVAEKGANFIGEGGKKGWNTAEHLAHKGKKVAEKGANFIGEGGRKGWNTAEHLAHKGKKVAEKGANFIGKAGKKGKKGLKRFYQGGHKMFKKGKKRFGF